MYHIFVSSTDRDIICWVVMVHWGYFPFCATENVWNNNIIDRFNVFQDIISMLNLNTRLSVKPKVTWMKPWENEYCNSFIFFVWRVSHGHIH